MKPCLRADCRYRERRPEMPWNCNYSDRTGRTKLGKIYAGSGDAEPASCPFYEPERKVWWTEEQQEQLDKLYALGLSDREIGRQMEVHYGRVGRWRRAQGLPPNGQGGRKRKEKP